MIRRPTERQIIRAWLKDRAAQTSLKTLKIRAALARALDLDDVEKTTAWLRGRLERIRPSSGLYDWVCEAIAGLENGEHGEAFVRGDLDDLLYSVAERRRMEVP